MAYITEADLRLYLTQAQRTTIKRAQESDPVDFLAAAMRSAEHYVDDRLSYKYNMQSEFDKSGSSRNATLADIVCKIAVRKAVMAFDMLDRGGSRELDYEEAMEQLDKIEKGYMLSDKLPKNEPDSSTTIRWGKTDETELKY